MHHIQDLIITIGSLIFIVALIPTIINKDKPPLSTSVTTTAVLLTFAGVYISLNLWFSAATTFGSAACWGIIAIQKSRQQ